MAQRLILPINNFRITAAYKNSNYRTQFGYTHYGVDATDVDKKDKRIWASGNGTITHLGLDRPGKDGKDSGQGAGNCLVVVYKDCELPGGKVCDLAIRYYHLEKFGKWNVGDKVNKDCILGYYGNTGASSGDHLHIEIDTDVSAPNYSPQTASHGNIIKSGIDTTLNPVNVLWVKSTKPDYQRVVLAGYNTATSTDKNYKITN